MNVVVDQIRTAAETTLAEMVVDATRVSNKILIPLLVPIVTHGKDKILIPLLVPVAALGKDRINHLLVLDHPFNTLLATPPQIENGVATKRSVIRRDCEIEGPHPLLDTRFMEDDRLNSLYYSFISIALF